MQSSSSHHHQQSSQSQAMSVSRKRSWFQAQDQGNPLDPIRKRTTVGDAYQEDTVLCQQKLVTADAVPTLLELAAKVTAETVCFQHIEQRYSIIPEPVQRRLLFWAFPTDERRIRLYSCRASGAAQATNSNSCTSLNVHPTALTRSSSSDLSNEASNSGKSSFNDSNGSSSFAEGVRHLDNDCVEDALQIGFHLSGTVHSMRTYNGERYAYRVSMAFDRGKITSVKCTCDHRDIHWCHHSVALALFRIRRADRVKFRLTISDSLSQLNRDQLQKLVQYLIAEHYTEVLPTAQNLVDELLLPTSDMNAIAGAPDPTAGSDSDSDHRWYIDETQTRNSVRSHLNHPPCVEELQFLFLKVREMLFQRDDNGPRLLRFITEEFLFVDASGVRSTSTVQAGVLSEKLQQLWDQLGALWVCVTLNPYASTECKQEWQDLLKAWILLPSCPLESAFCLPNNTFCDVHGYQSFGSRQKTVLHRAVDACHVKWTDPRLLNILESNFDWKSIENIPIWNEPFPTVGARIDCLKSHGYVKQAVSLSVSFVQNLKLQQQQQLHCRSNSASSPGDGWLGHPLDPVNTLFDCLHDASKTSVGMEGDILLSMAVEAALIGCAQWRKMARCRYVKEKACKQEESLFGKLKKLNLHSNEMLMETVKRLANKLLFESTSSCGTSEKSTPLHSLASFLFQVFINHDADLAYKIGLQALQIPFSEDQTDENGFLSQPFTWPIPYSTLETRRSNLASNLLISAKDDAVRLRVVLSAIQTNTKSSNLVYRLANDIYNEALNHPDGSTSRLNLLNIAFELGLQVLKIVANNSTWCRPNVVRWVVTCATSLNFDAILVIVHNWANFFTPLEAVSVVARLIWSDPISVQLKLDCHQRTILSRSIYQLALECAAKAPAECSLHALTLCKNEPDSFEKAYQLVVDAGEKSLITPEDLFAIGQHMERLALIPKAYQLALLALSNLRIGHSDESSPLVSSVYWACSLADSLGSLEFARVIRVVVQNVRCATVLSDVLKLCAFPNRAHLHRVTLLDKQCNLAGAKVLIHTQPHLLLLLDSAIASYVDTVRNRLAAISPRHYCEFIEFLIKARETFVLTDDGDVRFGRLLEELKNSYKGKKKLVALITQRFG